MTGHALDGEEDVFGIARENHRLRRRDQSPLVTDEERDGQIAFKLLQHAAYAGLTEPHGLGRRDGGTGRKKCAQHLQLLDIHRSPQQPIKTSLPHN